MTRGWQHKLLIADLWNDDDLLLPAKGAAIVSRIKTAPFYDESDEDLYAVVDELADAAADDDVRWFDGCWNAFYDWCDAHRVWVEISA